MGVPLLDLKRQYDQLKPELDAAVLRVLEHGGYILGPEVRQLEEKLAALCRVHYAAGVASGTDALLLALRAAGVQPGDEVITTDFSFFATAGVVVRMGARPVFIDIDPEDYNIDPSLIESAITARTKAIVPVHLFGQVADMDPIMEIARKHHLKVIEDAAQAIGATYKGRPAGSMGDFGCFSFYPSKNLGAGGDGGLVVTDDAENAEMVRILRVHGAKHKYYHKIVGYNSRLATVQAAILLVKLKYLREWSERRIQHARVYDEALADVPGITIPAVKDFTTFHIYNQYTIAAEKRDKVIARLKAAEIGYQIYYPVPFHKQECFAYLKPDAKLYPNSTAASEKVLSLPIYPELTPAEQDLVIETVKKAVA